MPAKAKNKDEDSLDQIERLLGSKEYKGLHMGSRSGTEIQKPDLVSTGSFIFDEVLGGGFRSCGWARFFADPECGKSSMGLCWGKQWQDKYPEDGVVVVFNAEGRITADLVERSGIDTAKGRFRIIDTNRSEAIWNLIEDLVNENPDDKKYYFMVDSTDSCVRESDIRGEKTIGEAEKIGGSATILSAAGKRLSLLFNLKCHFLFMTSQVRDKVNTHGPGAPGKDASGGNAPKFYSSLIGEIKKPWSETFIFENPSDTKSKPIGRLVDIRLHKTPNEKTGTMVKYPVKYGLIGGVWRAYEAMIMAQYHGIIIQNKAHYSFHEQVFSEIESKSIGVSQSFHGIRNMRESFDECPQLVEFVLDKVKNM